MATKQELELKVVELEAKIEELKLINFKLTEHVEAVPFVGDNVELADARSQIADLKVIEKNLTDQVVGLTAHCVSVQAECNTVRDQLRATIEVSLKAPVVPTQNNCVVLDGITHGIMYKEEMKELVDMWRKRHVSDEDIVVVVKK